MAGQISSSLRTPHSAFSGLLDLLDKIPEPTYEEAISGWCRGSKASNQLDDLKKDVFYIQRSLEKLGKFEQDLGTSRGEVREVDHASVVEMDELHSIHQLARAAQHFKNQLPSASYYQFPTKNYADESNPNEIEMEYSNLSLQEKKCLWCFSVFPENAEIKKRVLINWWIGEGLLTHLPLEPAGEQLLQRLQEKQLIKQVEKKMRGTDCWQMHPPVRSFLIENGEKDKYLDLDQKILDGKTMLLKSDLIVSTSIVGVVNPVSVFNVSKPTIGDDEAKTLASMKCLEVLHLGRSIHTQEVKIQENDLKLIIKNLIKMKRLRLLSFQGISSLRELQTPTFSLAQLMVLDLRACRALESLDHRRIVFLRNLRHLDMSSCHHLLRMPVDLGKLHKLEVIKGFVIGHMPRSCTLGKLRKLTKLHKLSLYVIRSDFPRRIDMLDLAKIEGLVRLKIVWNPVASQESEGSTQDADNSVSDEQDRQLVVLQKLQKLDLWCTPSYAAKDMLAPARFPRLRKLYVRGADINHLNYNSREDERDEAWSVNILRLRFLPELEMTWDDLNGLFPCLSYLERESCPKLPNDIPEVWLHSELASQANTGISEEKGHELVTEEQHSEPSIALKVMFEIAQKMKDPIVIPEDHRIEGVLLITKEEVLQWIIQEEIQASHISIYIGYLLHTHKYTNRLDQFAFLCPHQISEIPRSFNQEGTSPEQLAGVLKKVSATERARYIAKAMRSAKENQIFFAPYNSQRHWMLCVIHPFKELVFWLDPIGGRVRDDIKDVVEMSMKIWNDDTSRPNKPTKWVEIKCPKQTSNKDCGYYIVRYIHEIFSKGDDIIPEMYYPEFGGSAPYSKEKIDEIRDQWAIFVQFLYSILLPASETYPNYSNPLYYFAIVLFFLFNFVLYSYYFNN